MGSSKKKAKKKAESQKVKLKVGRRLQKSNVTSTAFKSGKLVLPDQIPQFRALEPSQIQSSPNFEVVCENNGQLIVLQEILRDSINKLTHCNAGARHKAVSWFRKTLSKNPSFIAEHLHNYLQKMLLLLRDSDQDVRKATRWLVAELVTRLNDAQFEPHWPLLSKHLQIMLTSSTDVNLHSECMNLIRYITSARPRAVIAHCTIIFTAFVGRLHSMPVAKLVPYLSVSVGDGSLAAIANSLGKNKNCEPVIDKFLAILSGCLAMGKKMLRENGSGSDADLCFSSKHYKLNTEFESKESQNLNIFIYSPLSLLFRMNMQQFSCGDSQNKQEGVAVTFQEKVDEIERLITESKRIKK